MEDKSNIIIEFLGLPGIGKTTISKSLKSKLDNEIIIDIDEPTNTIESRNRLVRILYKINLVIPFILSHPLNFFKVIQFVIKSSQESIKDFFMVTTNLLMILSLYIKSNKKNGINIYDQGFLQAIWAVLLKSRNKEYDWIDTGFENLFPVIQKHVVVYVNIEDKILKNLPNRTDKKGRFEMEYNNKKDYDGPRMMTEHLIHKINNKDAINIKLFEINNYSEVQDTLDKVIYEVTKKTRENHYD